MRLDAGVSPTQTPAYTGMCDNKVPDCQIFLMQYDASGSHIGIIISQSQKMSRTPKLMTLLKNVFLHRERSIVLVVTANCITINSGTRT
jgi:hypothetical protein